jgi:hypothetical protein
MNRALRNRTALLALTVLAACVRSPQSPRNVEAETAGPHIATLCVPRNRWPDLINRMQWHAEENRLSFHGEMTESPSGGPPIFNYYVAAGYNYVFGDDLDLWITSDSFQEGRLDFNAVPRHKPMTAEQMKLALGLLTTIRDLSTKTIVGNITPNTPAVLC